MKIVFLFVLCFLTSCSSTKKETDLATRLFNIFENYTKELSEENVRKVASEKPKLPEHFSLAVYFKDPLEKAKSRQQWDWSRNDKDMVMSSIHSRKGRIGKVFELINTSGDKEDLKTLKLMAAQQGADGLLLIQGVSEVESDLNSAALTYLVIVPAFFVNGNDVDGKFLTQAVLWDVNKAYVHLGAQSEGEYDHKRPIAFRQIPRVIEKSKEESLQQLTAKLKSGFAQI